LAVLLVPRLIEAVFLANVLFDGGWQSLLAGIEVSGSQFDQGPGERDHDEDRWDRDQESSDYEAKHLRVLLLSQTRCAEVPLGRIAFDVHELPCIQRRGIRIHSL